MFLIILFIFRGLETVLPLVKGYLSEQNRQEVELTAEHESNGEKSSKKLIEIKEFLDNRYNDYASAVKYALLPACTLPGKTKFIKKVFLSIDTPPPKFNDRWYMSYRDLRFADHPASFY